MEITNETFEAANRRGQAMKVRFPAAVVIRYDHHLARVVVSLPSGLDLAFSPQDAQGRKTRPLTTWRMRKSVLTASVFTSRASMPISIFRDCCRVFSGSKRWMAELGKRGGAASTAAKATTARQNGKLGGRPRKSKVPVAV